MKGGGGWTGPWLLSFIYKKCSETQLGNIASRPEAAQHRHVSPLSGEERTSNIRGLMTACDPHATLAATN